MVKFGGYSYNTGSDKHGVKTRFKCDNCGRNYKMEWARNNHQKACTQYINSLNKWQKENKGKWGLK